MEKNELDSTSDDMFVGYNDQGEERVFYKLLEYDSKETGKHYIAYTDNTKDENDNIKAYGSVVVKDGENIKLEPIQTEKEWKVIETALNVLQSEVKKNGKKNEVEKEN